AVLNQDVVWGTLWTGELKVRRSLGRHGLTLGAEFQDNLQADQVNYNLAPFRLFVNSHPGRFTNWSLYAEDEFKLTRRLSANLGVRQDRYPNFGSTTNPRIGLIYRPLPGANLKFLYGSAFRAPTPFETYYYSPGYAANTSLRPETMKTYEVVVENTLGKHVRLTTDFFHNQLRNLIVDFTEANGDVVFRNSEASNATGIEFEVSAALTRGMEMRASYSYARASDERTHLSLTNSPRHLGKFNFHVPISRDKLFAGVGAQYTSERWTLAGHTTSGFPLVNLTLMARNLNSHLDLSASLYNAFNRTFYDPALPGYPLDRIRQDGRSFGFKLTWHSRSEKP
ncbi:MAG TPA: TonB-dependent receptor, partial [Terriglobales bacterium]|nr:TonB-dependent receptor [Terriglobales bacterium]